MVELWLWHGTGPDLTWRLGPRGSLISGYLGQTCRRGITAYGLTHWPPAPIRSNFLEFASLIWPPRPSRNTDIVPPVYGPHGAAYPKVLRAGRYSGSEFFIPPSGDSLGYRVSLCGSCVQESAFHAAAAHSLIYASTRKSKNITHYPVAIVSGHAYIECIPTRHSHPGHSQPPRSSIRRARTGST